MIDHVYVYIGLKIKRLREDMGLSQKEFGEIIELSINTIGSLEDGRAPIHIKPLYKLAAKLDIPVYDFLPTIEQLEAWDIPAFEKRIGPGRPRSAPWQKEKKRCFICGDVVVARERCSRHYKQLQREHGGTSRHER